MNKISRLSVAITCATFSFFATGSVTAAFPDVSSDYPFHDAIEYVQSNGIVSGYPDGTYRPDTVILRSELTKIIVGATIDASEIDNCMLNNASIFPDVQPDEWFAKYVCAAKVKGIVGGYPDGTFRPGNTITFVEAAKIISAGFGYESDENDIWYKGYVESLSDKHAIPPTIRRFAKTISRGEMAEMIYRLKTEQQEASMSYGSLLAAESEPNYNSITTKLLTTPSGLTKGSCEVNQFDQYDDVRYVVSPDGTRAMALGCDNAGKKFIFAYGKLHSGLDGVEEPIFSKDGKHDAFFYRRGSTWTMTVDGQSQEMSNGYFASWEDAEFSPDGRLMYSVSTGTSTPTTMYIGDTTLPGAFEDLPVFSADGKSMAYRTSTTEGSYVVFNGIKGESFGLVSKPVISPDGSRVAYIALKEWPEEGEDESSMECVIVIGKTKQDYACNDPMAIARMPYGHFPPIVFSTDGKTVAYPILDRPGKMGQEYKIEELSTFRMNVNGSLSNSYNGSLHTAIPAINPQNDEVAFVAYDPIGNERYRMSVVQNDAKGKQYHNIETNRDGFLMQFTPDGQKLVYAAVKFDEQGERGSYVIVINGEEGPEYDRIKDISISPDGKRIAYLAEKNIPLPPGDPAYEEYNMPYGTISDVFTVAVIDGKEVEEDGEGSIQLNSVVFSPDSRHVAYFVYGEKNAIALDGQLLPNPYDKILTAPEFSSDGKRLSYAALKGKEVWWVVHEL